MLLTVMNKTLKFAPSLVPLILNGSKTTTWRLFDDKDLSEGDVVDFLESGTRKSVAVAKLTKIHETTLGNLKPEEKLGHEQFASDQEMLDNFSNYYNREVTAATPVKIIKYEIISSDEPN